MTEEFGGTIGRTYEDSTPWWPPLDRAPDGAPNVVIVLLDDVGYAQLGCYGSDIATPTLRPARRRRAAATRTSTRPRCARRRARACSPAATTTPTAWPASSSSPPGFPGYNATIPKENGFLSEILVRNGYATYAVGKWHLTPGHRDDDGQPARHAGRSAAGFERYYGFMGGETDQYHPDLVYDNHPVEPPRTPEEGYHLTEDLADQAILFLNDLRADRARQAVLPLVHTRRVPRAAPGAGRVHRALPRALRPGLGPMARRGLRAPARVRAAAAGHRAVGAARRGCRPWDSLSADEQRLAARMMEVFAGFLTHTDAQVARVLDFIDRARRARQHDRAA